ncbi:MAG: NUDIX domain-containing protein [Nanoarchaeota archaeon]
MDILDYKVRAIINEPFEEGGRGVFLIQTPNTVKSNRWTTPGGNINHAQNPKECISRHIYDDLGIIANVYPHPLLEAVQSKRTSIDVFRAELPEEYNFIIRGNALNARFFAPREIFTLGIALSLDNRIIFSVLAKRGFFGDEFRSSCLQTVEIAV